MTLTASEMDSLRHHLGYGNIAVGAEPYTPDTFFEVFNAIVSPYLSTGNETSASATIAAGASATVTPASMTGIATYGQLVVDADGAAEVVVVKATTSTTFTASFQKAHSGTYPIATMSGKARLRLMLREADAAWASLMSQDIGAQAGLKSVDKGDVEWFGGRSGQGNAVLSGRAEHYRSIVWGIANLVQVPPKWAETSGGGTSRLEAY